MQPSQRPVSQPTFRPASDGYIHPAAGVGPISNSAAALRPASGFGLDLQDAHANGAAAVSRRAADPTRLLPWLRDKNKRFKTLTPEECDAMFRFASLHRLEANTILQPLDAPPTACFAIITGAIVARIRRPNGSFRELDRFGPGEVVGLLALVDGGPSPYEIQAASAVEVIAFEADKLAQFVAAMHPDALLALRGWTPMLIDYLRTVQQRVARLSTARRSRIQSRDNDVWKAGKG